MDHKIAQAIAAEATHAERQRCVAVVWKVLGVDGQARRRGSAGAKFRFAERVAAGILFPEGVEVKSGETLSVSQEVKVDLQ